MVPTSYLRAYQPLASFSADERERWGSAPEEVEAWSSISRLWLIGGTLPSGLPLGSSIEGAYVRNLDGWIVACPWRLRLRMLAGLLTFRDSLPDEVAGAFVPEQDARRAASELAGLARRHPALRSHILQSNWHVPLRWFAAFDGSERTLIEDKQGLRVRYETRLSEARARLDRALEILESSGMDEEVTSSLREVSEWVSGFPQEGLLELDYGSVASLFPEEELADDHSASDVAACLDALESGDGLRAGRVFESLTDKWTQIRAREIVN